MRAQVKYPLGYSLGDPKILEASCCTYLGINLQNDLNWADQVNYTVQKAWKALHLVMNVLKKEIGIQNVLPPRHWYVLFLNMRLHAGIHAEDR